jgi:hypothetical protein
MQGIGGDHPALEVEHAHQVKQGVDLIGSLLHGTLAQHQPRVAGPGADEVQRCGAASLIEGPPGGLAVQGNKAALLRGLVGCAGELRHRANSAMKR